MFWRKSLVDKAIRRRFIVTLAGNEGIFSGNLADNDGEMMVFEQCKTVPDTGGTPQDIAGRVYVNVIHAPTLQELTV